MSELRIGSFFERASNKWIRAVHYAYSAIYILFGAAVILSWRHSWSRHDATFWSLTTATLIVAAIGVVYMVIFEVIAKRNMTLAGFVSQFMMSVFAAYLIESSHGANMIYQSLWLIVLFLSSMFGGLVLLGETLIGTMVASFTLAGFIPHPGVSTRIEIVLTLLGVIVPLFGWLFIIKRLHQNMDPLAAHAANLDALLAQEKIKSGVVLQSIQDGVIVVNTEGNVILTNKAVGRITGYEPHILEQKSALTDILIAHDDERHIAQREWLEENLKRVLAGANTATTTDFQARHLAEKPLNLTITISPIRVDETIMGAVVSVQDSTKERRLEQERINFIATASHEMRTPVAEIEAALSYLNTIHAYKEADPAGFHILEDAHGSIVHLAKLTNHLMLVSQLDTGQLSAAKQEIPVVLAIQETINKLKRNRPSTDTIQLVAPPSPNFFVCMSREYFDEIFANLLENALNFSSSGQAVVSLRQKENALEFTVDNPGAPIASDMQDRLFQKFGRTEDHLTREKNGTGLGLYIVKSLAEYSGGSVEYKYTDGRHQFIVLLPLLADLAQR